MPDRDDHERNDPAGHGADDDDTQPDEPTFDPGRHTPAFLAIRNHFDGMGLKYEIDDRRPIVRIGFHGEHGARFLCTARVAPGDELFRFLVQFPFFVPADKRVPMSEAIVRANYGLATGCFEMDLDDGELRFRTSARFTAGVLPDEAIAYHVAGAVMTADRYFVAFMAVLAGADPAVAIRHAERRGDRSSPTSELAGVDEFDTSPDDPEDMADDDGDGEGDDSDDDSPAVRAADSGTGADLPEDRISLAPHLEAAGQGKPTELDKDALARLGPAAGEFRDGTTGGA